MKFYTVGSLIPRKNIIQTIISLLLVNLFHKKNHTLIIYGDGPLKPIVKLFSNTFKSISYKGYENKDVLLGEIINYDALLLFSKREAFGLVYMEALNEAIPVGCLKDEGISDLIEHYSLGIVSSSSSINNIYNAILKFDNYMVDKSKFAEALGEFNKEAVLKRYLNQ